MDQQNYLQHLESQLSALESKMLRARRILEKGEIADRVAAAGALTVLEARRQKLEDRVKTAVAAHAEDWSTLRSTLAMDVDTLKDALTQWINGHAVDALR